MSRLLIVEDEVPLARTLARGLAEEGYAVDIARDGDEALWAARGGEFDLIILDLMLPGVSGMEVCRRLRAGGHDLPILMLTAKDTTEEIVAGLDCGANDYLTKPFEFRELLARLRVLARMRTAALSSVILAGDLQVDTAAKRVTFRGETVDLTAKEYQLLEYLVRHQGTVLSAERLINALWSFGEDRDSGVIRVYVANLRRKIERRFGVPLIETVRGLGYVVREAGNERNRTAGGERRHAGD